MDANSLPFVVYANDIEHAGFYRIAVDLYCKPRDNEIVLSMIQDIAPYAGCVQWQSQAIMFPNRIPAESWIRRRELNTDGTYGAWRAWEKVYNGGKLDADTVPAHGIGAHAGPVPEPKPIPPAETPPPEPVPLKAEDPALEAAREVARKVRDTFERAFYDEWTDGVDESAAIILKFARGLNV